MKKEFLSKSGLVIYDEELKQYFEERFGDGISEALSDVNNGDPIYVWIGTKEEYETIEEKLENCLYITTNDSENVEFENTSNKVTTIDSDAKHTTYPSSRAVYEAIKTYGGTDIETTDVIDENSTAEEVPNAKATYDFVKNEMNNINEIIQSQTSTVYSGTSEPDASVGKVGDLWVVTE